MGMYGLCFNRQFLWPFLHLKEIKKIGKVQQCLKTNELKIPSFQNPILRVIKVKQSTEHSHFSGALKSRLVMFKY